jgi:hypothetical protein
LLVNLVLKCRQLEDVKNLPASPPGPSLSSDDKDALARYRRVFGTFDGEITFVMAVSDERHCVDPKTQGGTMRSITWRTG